MVKKLPDNVEIAQRAFQHFTHGLATGEWGFFIDMLTEDFTFWFPVGPYHGLNVGKQRAIAERDKRVAALRSEALGVRRSSLPPKGDRILSVCLLKPLGKG